jgi:hypothetical protein
MLTPARLDKVAARVRLPCVTVFAWVANRNRPVILTIFHQSPQLRRDDSGKAEQDNGLREWVGFDALPESGLGAVVV